MNSVDYLRDKNKSVALPGSMYKNQMASLREKAIETYQTTDIDSDYGPGTGVLIGMQEIRDMPRGGSERENLRITRNSNWQTVETDAVKRNDYDSYNFPNIIRHSSPTEGSITQEDSAYGFDNNLDAAESKLIRIQPCNVEDYSVSKKKNQRYFLRKTQSGSKAESKLFKNFAASTT